jgi:hypothetical protein
VIQDLQACIVTQAAIFDIKLAGLKDDIIECRKTLESNFPCGFFALASLGEIERKLMLQLSGNTTLCNPTFAKSLRPTPSKSAILRTRNPFHSATGNTTRTTRALGF